ncbi:MAG: ABC transporter permease [Solirubrobacterales bacterium]|nr:ABC transporter permease [Solirubrobacterales bacterium]
MERVRSGLATIAARYTIEVVLVVLVIVLLLTSSSFGTSDNLNGVLRQSAFVGIGAAGMTLLIVSGAFDLSVASLLAVCGIAAGKLVGDVGVVIAVVAALLLGAGLGSVNGLIVSRLRVPAFVATLGTQYVYLAIAYIWTNNQVVVVSNTTFLALGAGSIAGIPTPFLFMIGTYLVCWYLFWRTRYGRHVRAMGSNEQASLIAGVPLERVRVATFALVGVCTALAGVLLTGLVSSADGTVATGYELNVIAAVVVGGTSLNGGRGTLAGSFAGALFFTLVSNALNLYGVGSYWQYVVTGLVLVSALGVEGLRRRFWLETI